VVGVQLDLAVVAVEVEVRRVGELALAVRNSVKILPQAPEVTVRFLVGIWQ